MLFISNEKKMRKRNYIIATVMTMVFALLIVRLRYVQLAEGPSLEVSANQQYYYQEYTNNLKFQLLDRDNEELFDYKIKYNVVVDPVTYFTLNEEKAFIPMKNISYILRSYNKDYDIYLLQYEMDKGNHIYEIDEEGYEKLKEINDVRGIYVYEYKEYDKSMDWNIKNVLATPFTYKDNSKLKDEGTLEREIYEFVKDNKQDKIRFEKDVSGNIISESLIEDEGNNSVVTTLDYKIQDKVQEILKGKDYEEYNQIGAVLMESKTGNILAMAQKDDKLSNVNIGVSNDYGYLIGSTVKTILYEVAMEKRLISQDKKFDIKDCDEFPASIEKRDIYNLQEAYIASSNKTFGQVGEIIGLDNIYEAANNQGIFDAVLGLQDENRGRIDKYKMEKNEELISNTSIGQTVRSTPLAMLAIPNTVVNNGVYVKPKILKEIINSKNEVVKKYESESRVVFSENTAKIIKAGMIGVVNDELGTGINAKIENLEVGGKTGTTEYPDNGKACSDVWFTGFFNYNNKYYSMVVFIPQSENKMPTSKVACSVFKNIAENLVDYGYLK